MKKETRFLEKTCPKRPLRTRFSHFDYASTPLLSLPTDLSNSTGLKKPLEQHQYFSTVTVPTGLICKAHRDD